jgi:transposase
LIAQGYETTRQQEAEVAGEEVVWTERVLVIYSPKLAQSQYRGLESRLQRAEEKVLALTPPPGRGKRQHHELAPSYRGAPNIERDFSRLKGHPLGLRPAYLQREEHLKGLVRLLSLALRILTLTEFVARRALAAEGAGLAGCIPAIPSNKPQGQPPNVCWLLLPMSPCR